VQIVPALNGADLRLGLRQRREQERGQNADNRHHHQKLDQREGRDGFSPSTSEAMEAIIHSKGLVHDRSI